MATTLWTTRHDAETVAQTVGGTAHDLGDGESWYVLGERSAATGTCSRWSISGPGGTISSQRGLGLGQLGRGGDESLAAFAASLFTRGGTQAER